MSFVRAANPKWFFNDLVGHPLDDTYYALFLTNEIPYVPQAIYRDNQGLTVWTNDVVQFEPSGGLPDNLYFDPDLVYRIEIRQGQTQADPLIWEINNFVPENSGGSVVTNAFSNSENQSSNTQFQFINFVSPLTINAAGTYAIAPDWDLVLTGAGATTISQLVNKGSDNFTTNPPYALRVNNAGWDTAYLRQRFFNNGALWSGGAVSASLTARADVDPESISVVYAPETPGAPVTIISAAPLTTAAFQVVTGVKNIAAPSANNNLSDVTYTDINIVLPVTGIVDISNVQIVGQTTAFPDDTAVTAPTFQQETPERILDHLFHFYQPQLSYKPIPSYLVGWDFPLNPAQFSGPTVAASAIGVNKSKYVWDQTIVFQSADSGVGVTRGTAGELLLTAAATTQMAIVQYLGPIEARKILNDRIAVNVSAKTSVVAGVVATVSLWYTTDASLPNIAAGTNNSIVLTLDANGKPATRNGTWSEVPRDGLGDAKFTVATNALTNFNDYSLTGWDLKGVAGANTATFFAIVVGFASVTAGGTIGVNSVSLNAGDIATRPAPQTFDEVLSECQFYYEKSYDNGTVPGTSTVVGALNKYQTALFADVSSAGECFGAPWEFQFNTVKRIIPTMHFYSTVGTIDNVSVQTYRAGVPSALSDKVIASFWTVGGISTKSVEYLPNAAGTLTTMASATNSSCSIRFQYVADCRLGL